MPLPWPGISNVGGDLHEDVRQAVTEVLNEIGDRVGEGVRGAGLAPAASPLFRPWNLVVAVDAEKVIAVFTALQGGVAVLRWLDRRQELLPFEDVIRSIPLELGSPLVFSASFPLAALERGAQRQAAAVPIVQRHLADVDRANRLGRLGDLSGLAHLEPALRAFLEDHPDPDRNVFIMMRFLETEQMAQIHSTVRLALANRGFEGIRADDRDYTGELWTNIEVCMTGCHVGVAIFEDIERRDFNSNVSLELGYMLGRRKRCLILKERRLPNLPTDVIHRLYKPFDVFQIEQTVGAQVGHWIDVDLRGL